MRALFLIALAASLVACDAGSPGSPSPGPDETVDGVNLSRLFAAPSVAEREAVRAEWADRDRTRAARYAHTEEARTPAPDGATLVVYAARSPGTGAVLHHGLVRLPPRAPGDVTRRPVLLVGPEDVPTLTIEGARAGLPFKGALADEVVLVVPAYRGQTLDVERTRYESPPDPAAAYDLDAEDALALLDAVRERASALLVDPDRVGAAGYGRGGTAALLAETRGGPFAIVASLAAPTDFFLPSVRADARAYLNGQGNGPIPAFGDVAATVLAPLRGGAGALDEARLALLRRSPAHFVTPPPFILAAHGVLDFVVPVAHGDALAGVQGTPGAAYLRSEKDDHRSLPLSSEVVTTATALFRTHLLRSP